MYIDLRKLEEEGFEYKMDNDKLNIYPVDSVPHHELREAIFEVGAIMGFNERETDELFGAAHSIQIISVIRRCSNW
jgi:hypothetical protein